MYISKRKEVTTMLKKDLIDKIAATGLTKKQAGAALEAVLDAISDSLKKGEPVLLTGFGKLKLEQEQQEQESILRLLQRSNFQQQRFLHLKQEKL